MNFHGKGLVNIQSKVRTHIHHGLLCCVDLAFLVCEHWLEADPDIFGDSWTMYRASCAEAVMVWVVVMVGVE